MKKLLRKLSNLLESWWKSIKKCFSSCLTIDSSPHNHNIQISQPYLDDKQSNDYKYYLPKPSPKYITLTKGDWLFIEKQPQKEYTENPKKKEPKGKTSDYLNPPQIEKRKVKSSPAISQQEQQERTIHYKLNIS